MYEWLTVPKLAELSKMAGKRVTERAIRKACERGKYPTARRVNNNKVGQGGKIWQIHISDPAIPPEIKAHLNNDSNPAAADGNKALASSPEPSTALSFPETHISSLSDSQGQGQASPVLGSFSEKARMIALARMDLLKAWEGYRSNNVKRTEAGKEFIIAFNNSLINKKLHDILGSVSVKSLYRWKDVLGNTSDWIKLIPGFYQKKQKGPRLDEEEKNTFLNFLLHPARFEVGTATRLTKARLESIGIPSDKSERTFRRFADVFKRKHYDIWVLAREGQKALKDKVEPFIKRDSSLLDVGDVFVADGHRLNFQIINPFTGKPCRAVLVGYIDWKSYDLAGFEIMIEENTQCIASALRNSIIRLGKIPKISYQDNGKAFRARFFTSIESFEEVGFYGLFGRLGIVPVFAQPYNARAKIIERFFKEFTNTCERLMPSFVGTSIPNRPAWLLSHEKLHKFLHNEYVPTIEEAIQFINLWLTWYRSQPCPHVKGKIIGEVFDEGRGSGFDISELNDLMLAMKISKIGRNGIRFLNSDYYNENLYGLHENVVIKFSLFDLSYIRVYSIGGEYLCNANRVMPVHPMANYFGEPKDMEELKQALSLQKRLRKETTQSVKELMKMGSPLAIPWAGETNVSIPIKSRVRREIEDSFDITPDQYSFLSEAMKEFMTYLPGVFLSQENRGVIEEQIEANGLNKVFVENFALEVRAQLARRGIEEIEQQRNTDPIFRSGWERYEFLMKRQQPTDEERQWMRDYEEGLICPGEYDAFMNLRQQDDYPENEQKRNEL